MSSFWDRLCTLRQAPLYCLLDILAHVVGHGSGMFADATSNQHRFPTIIEGTLDVSIDVVADHDVFGSWAKHSLHMPVNEFEGFASGFPIVNQLQLSLEDLAIDSLQSHVEGLDEKPR